MTAIGNDTYFVVRDKGGDEYLCPINAIKDRDAITEDEGSNYVERDIVGP